ncbi:hypothetical protein APHWI1_0381 [Anaplasma phagocytophilum str. ApWI1]|uniref:Uncharacterized protein n=3 Tax=Anaplasma phagocytophilum TaxID=948 RepID=Q2GJK0_ANAPZ|nr:hypothetical protein [Anaplasma phagocytophilum]ABD44182.1 hypothetical protein APH_0855 [Anaplasma phagocytophilum str. HZ]KJV63268.1 hypothetical protein EPHNCH_1180 [Anaplasma phagocytophilum str. NCH-1]KJV83406.1 hypothetical protein APHHGE2_1177 [Anaplasma phagocytophilum str. HGE2]KJV84139.1 hypothetical protein APHWI1_0381 [Anaplasma phagocytophilum str. ApWI1]KJV86860.1 hypothetical protein APHNYW_0891 [Anaplasma phagocytophilum str. ApNYW]KJV98419.1 hypothetical protein OTSANNIE_1
MRKTFSESKGNRLIAELSASKLVTPKVSMGSDKKNPNLNTMQHVV